MTTRPKRRRAKARRTKSRSGKPQTAVVRRGPTDWVKAFTEGLCYRCGKQLLNAYGEPINRDRFNGQEQTARNVHAAGRLREFCSDRCRQAAHRHRLKNVTEAVRTTERTDTL